MRCKHCHRIIEWDSHYQKWSDEESGYNQGWYFRCMKRNGPDFVHEPEEKEDSFDKLYLILKS